MSDPDDIDHAGLTITQSLIALASRRLRWRDEDQAAAHRPEYGYPPVVYRVEYLEINGWKSLSDWIWTVAEANRLYDSVREHGVNGHRVTVRLVRWSPMVVREDTLAGSD